MLLLCLSVTLIDELFIVLFIPVEVLTAGQTRLEEDNDLYILNR